MVVPLTPDKPDTLKRITIGIAVLVLISKGIGFLREIVVAREFGTSLAYDVYIVSVSIPLALYSMLSGAISMFFVPAYTRAVASPDRESSLKSLWTEFNLCLLGSVAAMIVIIAAEPFLIKLIAPGLNVQYLSEAVLITRVSSVIIIFSTLEAFFRSVLNAEKKFMVPVAAPILASFVLIGSIVVFAGQLSTRAILFGLVGGYLLQLIVIAMPFCRIGLWKSWHARLIKPHLGQFFVTAVIILVIEATAQVYSIVDRYFASSMNPGIISALNYSYLMIMLPISVFAYALSMAIFPFMSDAFVSRDEKRSVYLISQSVYASLFMAIAATLILWVFGEKLIVVLFQRGAFNDQSVVYTSSLLKYFALGLPGSFVLWVMMRAYYASGKYSFLIMQTVLTVMIKVAITPLAVAAWGSIGLALSSSISYTIGAMILIAGTRKYLARIDEKKLGFHFIKLLAAGGVGYLAAILMYRWLLANSHGLLWSTGSLILSIFVTVAAFALIAHLLGIRDVGDILKMWKKKGNADADAN